MFVACSSDDEVASDKGYSDLPVWMQPRVEQLEKLLFGDYGASRENPSLFYGVYMATGIHGETVYRVYNSFSNCLMCELYDEKGNSVAYVDVFGSIGLGDTMGDEGWVLVYPK